MAREQQFSNRSIHLNERNHRPSHLILKFHILWLHFRTKLLFFFPLLLIIHAAFVSARWFSRELSVVCSLSFFFFFFFSPSLFSLLKYEIPGLRSSSAPRSAAKPAVNLCSAQLVSELFAPWVIAAWKQLPCAARRAAHTSVRSAVCTGGISVPGSKVHSRLQAVCAHRQAEGLHCSVPYGVSVSWVGALAVCFTAGQSLGRIASDFGWLFGH